MTIEETVSRLPLSETTSFDERTQGWWLKRVYATYGESPTATEWFCFFNRHELARAINDLLDNILTSYLEAYNDAKTWRVTYQVALDPQLLAAQADVLRTLQVNKVRQRSMKMNDAPRLGKEAIEAAAFQRHLIKGIRTLEQEGTGAVGFKVGTTNYELTIDQFGSYVLRRNGKVYDIFERGRGRYV